MKSRSAFDCGLSLDNALGTATQMMPSVVPSRLITSYTHVETEERFVSGLGITAFCELFAAHTLRSGSRAGLQCNRRSYLHTFSRQRTLAGCVPGHTVPGPISAEPSYSRLEWNPVLKISGAPRTILASLRRIPPQAAAPTGSASINIIRRLNIHTWIT